MKTLQKTEETTSILNVSRSQVFVMIKCSDFKPVLFERSLLACPEDQEHFINHYISGSASNLFKAKLASVKASLEFQLVNHHVNGGPTYDR